MLATSAWIKIKTESHQHLWVSSLWLCSSGSPWRGCRTARRKSPRTVSPSGDTRFKSQDWLFARDEVCERSDGQVSLCRYKVSERRESHRGSYLIVGVEAEWKADGVGGHGVGDHGGRRQSCSKGRVGQSRTVDRTVVSLYVHNNSKPSSSHSGWNFLWLQEFLQVKKSGE